MISSSGVYGVKMQWTPEHTQWAEQHFDISSTTRSPSHKAEGYRMQRVAGTMTSSAAAAYQYSWANDDISALTASNLLKKYAEKYSGILDVPVISAGERALLNAYPDAAAAAALANGPNGRKVEADPWAEPVGGGVYPMGCEVAVPAGKVGMAATSDVAAGALCSSPGVGSGGSLAEQSFSSSSCGSQSLASQEPYASAAAYGSSYLHASSGGYSGHPSPLLQAPPPPPASHATLVPAAYSTTSSPPALPGYSYTPSGYAPHHHHQAASVAPGYSPPPPPPPPPPSSYLPAGIAVPTPLAPSTTMASYSSYAAPPHSLAPITPTPLNGCGSGSLKRKAFYMVGQAEMGEPYGDFGYSQPPPSTSASLSPLYRLPEGTNGNGSFKAGGQTSPSDDPRGGDFGGGSLTSPGYVGASKTPHSAAGESAFSFGSPTTTAATNGSPVAAQSSSSSSSSSSAAAAEERLKSVDPRVLELVSTQVLQQQHPLLDWGDIAGLEAAKATLKEEVLWPLLRPDVFGPLGGTSPPLPRALLLFGPPGSGRTLLARCMSGQMGAPLLHLRGSVLTTEWAAEAEQLIQACFLVARARQPCVLLLSEAEAVLGSGRRSREDAQSSSSSAAARVRRELQAQLDRLLLRNNSAGSGSSGPEDTPQILVLASTSRPDELDEAAVHRYFARRLLVPPPDGPIRRQIISQNLAPHSCCLSEEEVGLLVQRTDGYSALGLARLCQEALRNAAVAGGMELPLIRPVTYQDLDAALRRTQPDVSHKDMDAYVEWSKMFGCRQ
ncbi:fidgetin isoform X1 [Alosa sapidissima]|uniref:fidgetin isoform X1 n=2 Tax=Alosa sapidissima TaxID=34773 RepID=UPI001C09DE3A|nr:fidgetin isoform X1 [Alosa sapidissima]